jgi:hypothetical protein
MTARPIELVGPKGYVHGWKFVGVPAPGDKVTIRGHGRGTVVSGTAHHARVRFADGKIAKVPHDRGSGKPRLVPHHRPVIRESPRDAGNRKIADASMKKGEALFHGTPHQFKPGDIIDAHHSNAGVTRLHEGRQFAFASTDAGEATFAGKASRDGHVYKVVPVDKYEFDPHQGSATSRRTSGGFRVVSEVEKWSGKTMAQQHSK